MKTKEEIETLLEQVLVEYDDSVEGGKMPDSVISAMRDVLEWILGDGDYPDPEDYRVRR